MSAEEQDDSPYSQAMVTASSTAAALGTCDVRGCAKLAIFGMLRDICQSANLRHLTLEVINIQARVSER
jgi:hypothetical protein